ncbi:MAG: methionyl-tRNA formyltransferase [Bdellovibrionota bacterium]
MRKKSEDCNFMLRVVFMGTPKFAVPALRVVARDHDIVAVYTQPDRPVGRGLEHQSSAAKRAALELGLKIFQPEKLSLPEELERLKSLNPDVIVVVAFGQILSKGVLSLPRLGCVNIHSSLLPRWRGAAPIQRAILEGDKETGITTMRISDKLDAGGILLQASTVVNSDDTAASLHDRLAEIGAKLIVETLSGLEKGTLTDRPQNDSLATYAAKLSKDMEWLDTRKNAVILDRQVRALNPWPGTSVMVKIPGDQAILHRLKIKQIKLHDEMDITPGEILVSNGMLLLGTVKGCLEIVLLQWDGRAEVDAAGFLNGLKGRGWTLPLKVSHVTAI